MKTFITGDHVRVIEGEFKGHSGLVISYWLANIYDPDFYYALDTIDGCVFSADILEEYFPKIGWYGNESGTEAGQDEEHNQT